MKLYVVFLFTVTFLNQSCINRTSQEGIDEGVSLRTGSDTIHYSLRRTPSVVEFISNVITAYKNGKLKLYSDYKLNNEVFYTLPDSLIQYNNGKPIWDTTKVYLSPDDEMVVLGKAAGIDGVTALTFKDALNYIVSMNYGVYLNGGEEDFAYAGFSKLSSIITTRNGEEKVRITNFFINPSDLNNLQLNFEKVIDTNRVTFEE